MVGDAAVPPTLDPTDVERSGQAPTGAAQAENSSAFPARPTETVAPPMWSTEENETETGVLLVALLVLGLVVAGIEMVDRRREQRDEAVHLASRIADALCRDRRLAMLGIAPTVRFPMLGTSPATIEIRGEVHTAELRQTIRRLVEREASRTLSAYEIQDRIAVVPSVEARAA